MDSVKILRESAQVGNSQPGAMDFESGEKDDTFVTTTFDNN